MTDWEETASNITVNCSLPSSPCRRIAMATVLGLGPGLFTLVLLWSLVILVCLVFMRARRSLALSAVAGAAIFTLLLSRIPIKAADHVEDDDGRVSDRQ